MLEEAGWLGRGGSGRTEGRSGSCKVSRERMGILYIHRVKFPVIKAHKGQVRLVPVKGARRYCVVATKFMGARNNGGLF